MIPIEQLNSLPLFHRETIPATYLDVMGHMNVRRTSPFPEHIATTIDARISNHKQLDWRAPLCGAIQA